MDYEVWLKRKGLEYLDGCLFFAGVDTLKLTELYGTPIYVVSEDIIRKRYKLLKETVSSEYIHNDIHYAVKANSNISILRILDSEGSFFDCTSKGEIYTCFKAGIAPERIIFTGNMFTDEDFEFAIRNNVLINLDSLSQLERLVKIYDITGKEKRAISFRINPEFGAGHHAHTITAGKDIKFGILENQVLEAYQRAKDYGFMEFGIHQHIGSGIINPKDYEKAVESYLSIVKNLAKTLNIKFEFVNFGGGLGIPYHPGESPLDLDVYTNIVINSFKKTVKEENIGEPTFKIEPGRYLVAESSIILAQINTIKNNGYKMFAGLNAGLNTIIRPAMYGSYHHIILCNKQLREKSEKYDITGPICESGDVLGKDRELPELQEGDILAILDAGAYGYMMSSTYNSRPRAAEILISNGVHYKIREAETYDDLLKSQIIPEHLK